MSVITTEGSSQMRVLIVVDNALTAEAIRREMRHVPSYHVIGFVNGRSPCAMTVAQAAPDLVVVDDMSERELTLSRVREIRMAVPTSKIILLTVRMDPAWLAETAEAGVHAAICKAAPPQSVGMLIRAVATGNVFHAFDRVADQRAVRTVNPDLTARELEILRWVAAGESNGSIARQLFVTEQTVKFHLSNIYRKLGVANRTQASHFAYHNGLLEAPSNTGAGVVTHLPVAA
jgi:DNA-binding NarL/FixJ family response regulator